MQIAKRRPAIFNVELDFAEAQKVGPVVTTHCKSWGWVKIWDLLECLNELRVARGLEHWMQPQPIFRGFSLLNRNFKETVATTSWVSPQSIGQGDSMPGGTPYVDNFMVPAGWANNVIDLVTANVREVVLGVDGKYILVAVRNDGKRNQLVRRRMTWVFKSETWT